MTKRWRSLAEYDLSNIDVEAVIRREILIQQGKAASSSGAVTQGEIISALGPQEYSWIFWGSCMPTDSSIQNQSIELQRMLPFGPSGIVQAHEKVVAQMRRTPEPKSPLVEGSVAEDGFVYPTQKVANIRKGRRLVRKNLTSR